MWFPFHWAAWFGGLGNDRNQILRQGEGNLLNAPSRTLARARYGSPMPFLCSLQLAFRDQFPCQPPPPEMEFLSLDSCYKIKSLFIQSHE